MIDFYIKTTKKINPLDFFVALFTVDKNTNAFWRGYNEYNKA